MKDLSYITWKNCFWLLALTVPAQLSLNRICYQLSQPEIEFDIMERFMWHCACTHVQRIRLMNEKKNEKNKYKRYDQKIKMNLLLAHTSLHIPLWGIFYSQERGENIFIQKGGQTFSPTSWGANILHHGGGVKHFTERDGYYLVTIVAWNEIMRETSWGWLGKAQVKLGVVVVVFSWSCICSCSCSYSWSLRVGEYLKFRGNLILQ